MTRAYSKAFIGGTDQNQIQSNNTNSKHRGKTGKQRKTSGKQPSKK